MSDVASRDIMRAAGITSAATLTRWHKREGLIPQPEIRTHPDGRGKMAYWPEWVLQRCVRIKQLRKEGQSLAQIREFLGCDWNAAAKLHARHARRYVFSEVSRRMDESAALTNVRDVIANFISDWMNDLRAAVLKTWVPMIAVNSIDKAIAMLEQGINPVFVVTRDKAILTADFAVSLKLAKCRCINDSFMVIPLRKELAAYLSKLAEIPEQPSISPCAKVVRKTNLASEEAKAVVLDSWEFELEPPKPRSSKRTRQEP